MEELFQKENDPVPIAGAGTPLLQQGESYIPQGTEIGYLEAMKRGVRENHIVPLITDAPETVDDPNFWWDDEKVAAVNSQFKDANLVSYVLEAQSQEEANARMKLAASRQETIEKLGQAGWDKTGAYILAGIVDPTEIAAVTALTAGVGVIPERLYTAYKGFKTIDKIKDAEKARRMTDIARRAGYGAAEGAAYSAVFEGIRAAYQPDASASSLPLYIAFGGALGATTEAGAAAWGKLKRVAAYDKRIASGIPLLPEEEELFKDIIADRSLATVMRNMDSATPTGGGGSAAEAFDANDLGKYANAPEQRGIDMFGLRQKISSVARAMSSEIGAIRTLAQKLGLNSAGNTDGSAVPVGAIEYQSWAQASSTARFLSKMQPLRDSWIREVYGSTFNPLKRQEYERKFNEQVTKAMRRPTASVDERVREAAKTLSDEYSYFFNEAKSAKARGFMERDADVAYAPRIFDEVRIDELIRTHGRDQVVNLIQKAIKTKQVDIEDALAAEIADGYLQGIEKRIAGVGQDGLVIRMGVREDTLDDIAEALMAKYNDKAKVDEIINSFEKLVKGAPRGEGVARARSRIDLDETVSVDLPNGQKIEFEDLLMNDAEDLHQMYTFQVGGAIGLAKNGLEQEGMESIEKILDKLRQEAYKKGYNRDKLDNELLALKFMYDGLTGQLAHDKSIGSGLERRLRQIREYNFMTSMGSSGLASFAEIANVMFEHNISSIIKGVPRLRTLIKKMQTGQLEDDLLRELQQYTGTGIDMITGRMRTGFLDSETEFIKSDYTRTDAILAYGRNKVAVASGMLPLTAMFRRADSMFYAMDWHKAALKMKSGDYKAPFARIKMEQLGIDAETGAAIGKMINKYAVVDGKGNLKTLNLKEWAKDSDEGKKAFDAFSQSAYRHATQGIQETNLGSINRFFRTPIGKTVGQFLSFVLGSQEQQFQRLIVRARHGDAGAVGVIFAASAFVSTMVYVTRTYLNESGKSESVKQKNLEEKLQPWRIARDGSLGYMGALSIFSTAIQRINGNNLISNPTLDVLGKFTSFGKEAILGDKEMSEAKVRSYLRLLPFQNTYPLIVPMNALAREIAE